MDASQIAENGYAWNVLSVECKNAGSLSAQVGSSFWRWNMAMDMLVVSVIGGSYFRQEAGDHLDDIGDGH